VAIVAPIWKVVDLLKREDFVERRTELGTNLEKRRESEATTSDTAREAPVKDGGAADRSAAFDGNLLKVSRRKPFPTDGETSGT
jgi:hypothetical protein